MPPHSMTTNNMTMPPHSMTTNNMNTAPATATTTVATTTNTTLITNTTVIVLGTPVGRTGCGTQQICGSEPSDCDPSSSSSSCFFVSAKQRDGQNFEFSISGESSGYIAATVSADTTVGGNDTTYICANNNGKVKFFSALLDNDKLTLTELPVNSVQGRVDGNLIQCTFVATLDLSTTRAAATSASLSLSTGTFDNTSGSLGTPDSKFRSGVVDLSGSNATISNELTTTTTTANPMTNTMTTPTHSMTMTTNNMTMPPHSMTTNNMNTAPATATTTVATTTNTTLITNTTVIVLGTPVGRTGCGTQQICGSEPSDCDPSSSSSSCFFVSAKQRDGQNFEFSISGESSGYIAATVSADTTVGGNDTTYICANNNGKVKFFSALLDNDKLTLTELPVNSVQGRVDGNLIQCTFVATLDLSTTRAAATSASLSLSTGTFDSTSGSLGTPDSKFRSGVVDLSGSNATISNELTTTTTTANPMTNTMTTPTMTTNNMNTAPATATTTVATTTNTTLITNTTVIVLGTPVGRTGCGTQQICGSEPSDCDPSSSSSSCFFVSAKQRDGQNFEFSISGESSGYIAATVSADTTVGGNDTTYICANNNGKVKFFSALLDNDKLTLTELPVNSVQGRVDGNLIQCTFVATLDLSTTRAAATSASLSLSTGTFDNTSGSLGTPDSKFRSGVVDLSVSNATISNELTTTTTTANPMTNTMTTPTHT
ncbi:mucin-2-like [Platichthys flesus]|uniref:mucin-2-like n=1 Tax=Platichthys flesus TaxID=8260 RepID=UPI002DB6C2AC|nr:mucin-2-like [Platichthys flesus]